ncbi:uncharacterized protein LOC110116224 isoform X1 [Dendrobium catenatum]|uniref:Uncharacterized protein n=1 Tax=Dendrobium catenatum TaxID=906689 RepID=A0A2I0WNR1_9ASPA|nr:uncharacterized protein LOC110116224 isoform X1 [Dendrobium catenatum]PKU77293.1 hypothetical protein MA16_Dca016860 [Dendrobium catenatum]
MTAYRSKGTVSEDEVYALVQRYGASTIFTLLQEVSQATEKDVTMDWRTLVKATSTGISNAQEYQMLWRHLAYRDPLEKIEDGGEPLSDESDLEFELEATPNHSEEISTEVDCCVKVILSSGSVGECGTVFPLNAEAPPATDTVNDQASVVPSDKQHLGRYNRANGAALCTQKQSPSTGLSNEGVDGNGSSNSGFHAKKKRKLWTKEEDMELIAAVEKFGESNWANILKGDFKHDRTASQLSQRWSIIRKRQTSSKQSNGSKARSEEMLAAQKAFSMAINMPMSGSLSTILSGGTHMQTANSSASIAGGTSGALDESPACASQAFKPNQPINLETSSQKVPPNPSNKPRTAQKKPPSAQLKPAICPNPLIKAAAFAAGGRIATPLTAASLFKAAQSVNAVRIRHAGSSSLIGSSVTGTISSSSTTAATTTAATAPITGSHTPNSKFSHPSSGLTTSKLCQVQQGSGKAPLQQLSSESRLGVMTSCGRNENGKRRRSVNNSAVDVDQLLVEEAVAEPDDEASDKLVQDTKNGSSDRKIEENQCTETEETTSKNLKEEQSGEGKGRIVEVISPNSGDSQLEEEVILHS